MIWRPSRLRELFRPATEIYKGADEGRQFDVVYFAMLVLACLIALLGLLLNSPAVIIGAMLISPLMGPILACGLALTAADWDVGKKAARNVGLSVAEAIWFSSGEVSMRYPSSFWVVLACTCIVCAQQPLSPQRVTFAPPIVFPSEGPFPTGIASGDFNNDGIPDTLVGDLAASAAVSALGNGDGTFGDWIGGVATATRRMLWPWANSMARTLTLWQTISMVAMLRCALGMVRDIFQVERC